MVTTVQAVISPCIYLQLDHDIEFRLGVRSLAFGMTGLALTDLVAFSSFFSVVLSAPLGVTFPLFAATFPLLAESPFKVPGRVGCTITASEQGCMGLVPRQD